MHSSPAEIGERLVHIRAHVSQAKHAEALGVPLRTYQTYERGEREPDLRTWLALVVFGWNANWLLTGEGPERLDDLIEVSDDDDPSQPLSVETLTIAVQLAQEALEGNTLDPADYGQLVGLIYDALTNGLPSAQVLAFARPAARGLQVGPFKRF